MTPLVGRNGFPKGERLWWLITGLALIVLAGSLLGVFSASRGTGVVASAHHGKPGNVAPQRISVPRSVPTELTIPSLDISTRVGRVGLQPDHQVMVPTSVRTASWFRLGPTPGEVGSAVILGHVDSYVGPAVFFLLRTLSVGASIKVVLANGVVTNFAVTKVVEYSKSNFPDQLVYGSHGTQSLQLVTCGGVFNHATGHYESNIVVFSHLVGATPPQKT